MSTAAYVTGNIAY